MKTVLKHGTSCSRKVSWMFLVLAFILSCWYEMLYRPVHDRIMKADTEELEEAIKTEYIRMSRIRSMEDEIEKNKAEGKGIISSYDNFRNETDELNRIFGEALEFRIIYGEPEANGTQVRRNVEITCTARDYYQASAMLEALSDGPYRGLVQDVYMDAESVLGKGVDDIMNDPVHMEVLFTYYETLVDAESKEGLVVRESETEK